MWSIQAPNAKPRNGANKDCPQAFHALRAAANAKQPNAPRDRKKRNAGKQAAQILQPSRGRGRKRTLNNPLPTRFHPNFDGREIQLLEHRGLDKVRLRGADGFKLAVGLSVVAPDVHRLGLNLREAERKRMRRRKRAA